MVAVVVLSSIVVTLTLAGLALWDVARQGRRWAADQAAAPSGLRSGRWLAVVRTDRWTVVDDIQVARLLEDTYH
jgi:hypothetical protein